MISQDIDDTEQASILLGCDLFLPIEQLPALTGDRFYYHEIKGFQVIDLNFGETGRVEEVLEYPHQAILRVLRGNKEILIPITDDIITRVDRENKILHVNAPEGLIALYLE